MDIETIGLSELVLKGIRRKGYRLPTPIQRKAIPLILQGLDVVGMARTGSGKTAAFVIPMLEKLKEHLSTATGPRAVLLAPTRELALQTHKVVKEIGRFMNLRTAILVGGDSMEAQFTELAAAPDIIVATPGRLMHHLTEIQGFSLKSVEYAVFDEADRLFEMGFEDQLKEILSSMSSSRQTLLFSATLPKLLAEFARAGLRDAELVRLDVETKLSPDLSTAFFTVRQDDKPAALLFMLKEVVPQNQATIVFTATRHHVEFIANLLHAEGFSVTSVHGNMDQAARKIAIAKFRAGKASILVVTDVAARGLDIPLLDNVINYDFPAKPKLFVHRAGRAARAGRVGTAYSLATREELGYLVDLHLFLSRPISPAPVRGLADAAAEANMALYSGNAAEQDSAMTSYFGSFPQVALDDAIEHLRQIFSVSPDISSQKHAADNAMKLYMRTRPPASPESVRRAKGFQKEGIHPVLASAVPSHDLGGLEAQNCLADITEKLRAYRPSATVFENEVAPARAGQGAGFMATPGILAASQHERKLDVMKRKRATHNHAIKLNQRKVGKEFSGLNASNEDEHSLSKTSIDQTAEAGSKEQGKRKRFKRDPSATKTKSTETSMNETSSETLIDNAATITADKQLLAIPGAGPSGRFKEQGFFISHTPSDDVTSIAERHMAVGSGDQFRDAVLDLTNEQDTGPSLKHKRTLWHWDTKAKKYIKLQNGETVKAGKRIAAKGSTNKSTETKGLYAKWSKRTKMSIGKKESSEGSSQKSALQLADAMKGRFRHGGRGWSNPLKTSKEDPAYSNNRKMRRKNKTGANGGERNLHNELKRPEQVRKQRKMQERQKGLASRGRSKKNQRQ